MRGGRSLEVRLLGPLRLLADGVPVAVRGRPQVVLAALACAGGRRVSFDELMTHCWGEQLPLHPRAALQGVVVRLRAQIGSDAIKTVADGYELDTGRMTVDLDQFRELVRRAETSLAADRGDEATSMLREALDLWQGEALAGVPSDHLRTAARPPLDEERINAQLRRIDLNLHLGRRRDAIGDLQALTTRHPLREEIWLRLMSALRRDGRRAEALDAYHQVRRNLRDNLGIDPNADLQQLHLALLGDDQVPDGANDAAADNANDPEFGPYATQLQSTMRADASSFAVTVPRQLPPPPQAFSGRERELTDLERARDMSAVVITAIDGMAGVGKTALAVQAAHQLAGHYSDGQLFIDLHGYTQGVAPVEPAEALDRLLRALGVSGQEIPQHTEDRAALYRSLLADQNVLVVLDNAASEEQVQPLLPGAAGCLVLLTSRRRLTGLDHHHTISLDVLPQVDATALFASTAAVDGDATASEIVELCGRVPLAIRIAAGRLRSRPSWTSAHLVERLRDRHDRLDELEAGSRSVIAALDVSYHQLDSDLQRAYRLCGLHPGADFDLYATAALFDSAVREAERLIDELEETHLIQELVPNRYRFHDLVRAHAITRAGREETEVDRQAALDRMVDHYCHTASRAMGIAYPYERNRHPPPPSVATPVPNLRDPAQAIAWLDTELENLLLSGRYAADRGIPARTVHLSRTMSYHLRARHRCAEADALHERALSVARSMGDAEHEADALVDLAHSAIRGQHVDIEQAEERLHSALTIARSRDHLLGVGDALTQLAHLHRQRSRFGAATEHYGHALEIFRRTTYPSGEMEALIGLGWQLAAQGQPVADKFERALAVARTSGMRLVECVALDSLGHVYRREGRYNEAIRYFDRALSIAHSTENSFWALGALLSLAGTYRLQARYSAAYAAYKWVLDGARGVGDRAREFEALHGMGRLDCATGYPDQALARHRRALELATDLRQPAEEARCHAGLAPAHLALGKREQARRHWQIALDILTDLGIAITQDEEITIAAIQAHLTDLESWGRSQVRYEVPAGESSEVTTQQPTQA